jgi:pilus assembly protein CpaE
MKSQSAPFPQFDDDDDGFMADDEFQPAFAPQAGAALDNPFPPEPGFPVQAPFPVESPFPSETPTASGQASPDPFAIAEAQARPYDDEDDLYAQTPVAPRAPAANPVAEMIADAEQALGEVSVPRIVMHVFCLQASTRAAAEKAASDRRMARATTMIRVGGITAALEYYQSQPTPSLIVLESDQEPAAMLIDLDRLAEVCDPGTKVVVVGGSNDIRLYRELMKRGVSEYLVAPVEALPLIRTITGLYADPSTPFVGRTVAFVGAKGGVGASTIAHNVAYAISERLMSAAVIVDYDLPFGTAGLDFNQDPLQGVADALAQPDRLDATLLDRMMVRCTERLSLFAAPATLDSTYDISAEAFEEVSQKIRGASPWVIMDLPHIWSGWMRQTLLSADEVNVVATPDLASLRNAKNLFDLIRHARPNDAPPRLILNQVGVPGRPEIPVKDFAEALGVEPSLVLQFDAKIFGQAANNGQMVLELGGKNKAAEGLAHLAQLISKREAPPPRQKSLLAGLLKRSA